LAALTFFKAQAVVLQSDGEPSKVLSTPEVPDVTKSLSDVPIRRQEPFLAAQYSIEDGVVRLAEGQGQAIPHDHENTLKILKSLGNSPLGFPGPHVIADSALTIDQNGQGTSTKETNSASIEDRISISRDIWVLVKDCLMIVHYMNDFSVLDQSMLAEARVAWIRQFGWAPFLQEMHDAKTRAQEYRQETGRHITSLMTNHWLNARKAAYNIRGEGMVWTEMIADRSQVPPFTEESHHAEITPISPVFSQKPCPNLKSHSWSTFGKIDGVDSTDVDVQRRNNDQPTTGKDEKDVMNDDMLSMSNHNRRQHSAPAEIAEGRKVEEVVKISSFLSPPYPLQQIKEVERISQLTESRNKGKDMSSSDGSLGEQALHESTIDSTATTKQFSGTDKQLAVPEVHALVNIIDFTIPEPDRVAQPLALSTEAEGGWNEKIVVLGQAIHPEEIPPPIIGPSKFSGAINPSYGRNPFRVAISKKRAAQPKTLRQKLEDLGIKKKPGTGDGLNSFRSFDRATAPSLTGFSVIPAKRPASPLRLIEQKIKKHPTDPKFGSAHNIENQVL
jgi:hypothetical protein